ncbi:MAG: MBL fold metallo-hydrolase [Muribaculaceae bacterium]|nr:MBL fold metallo-hydrolase [Muribaculaceae bacterium]
MKLTFLGTGTSTGVPMISCNCAVCRSKDSRDKRLRCSALVQLDNGKNILIDCGPDFRTQMLALDSPPVEDVLITHTHYDHLGGIDDLRPYCYVAHDQHFPVYCRADVARDLRARVPYCFAEHPYPGVPTFTLHIVEPGEVFVPRGTDTEVRAIPVIHGKLPILGFRIGPLAYITDCSKLPEEAWAMLECLDTLVINALRIKPHPTHMSLSESLAAIERISPRIAYLTHLSHDMGLHAEVSKILPQNVKIAVDGMTIEI